jgi:hypothetical protein
MIDPTADEHRLADLELRTEQERATFDLYEHRRLAVETQATALTAAALTVGGLLLLGFEDLSGLGDVPQWGVPVALVGLIWALVCASLARFASWDTPKKYGGPTEPCHGEVKRTLAALREATEETDSEVLRQLAHALERSRDQRVEAGGVQVQAVEGGTVGAGSPGAVPGAGRWRPARASDRQRRHTRGSGQRRGNTQAATSRKRAEKRDAEPAPSPRSSSAAMSAPACSRWSFTKSLYRTGGPGRLADRRRSGPLL